VRDLHELRTLPDVPQRDLLGPDRPHLLRQRPARRGLYHEIPLPLDQRSIPTERLLAAEGRAAFDEWDQKPDKVQY
jgi:hypothetical protein